MKNLIVLLAVICSIQVMNAQNSIAIRGGINIAKQTKTYGDYSKSSAETLIGLTSTLVYRITVGRKFSIQPEISFLQKGESGLYLTIGNFSTTLNYIELPVLAVYPVFSENKLTLDAFVGPSIGFGLNGIFEQKDTDSSNRIEWGDNGLKRTEFSAVFGLDFQLAVETGKFVLDIRYLYGLSNIENYANRTLHNNGLAVSLGYEIPLKGK